VIYDPKFNSVVTVFSPNTDKIDSQDIPKYCTTLAKLEAVTGIKFFPKLPKQPVDRDMFDFNVKPGLKM
jgi:hypothetical protein